MNDVLTYMATNIAPLAPVLALVIGPATAIAVYFLGQRAYFRQKEYEMVRERYLVHGLDRAIARADSSLQFFRHNWSYSLNILKNLRNVDRHCDIQQFFRDLQPPSQALLELSSDRRTKELIGDAIIFEVQQLLAAFVHNSFLKMRDDLGVAVQLYVNESDNQLKIDKEKLIEKYFDMLLDLNTEGNKYYVFISRMQEVGHTLQKQRFSFSSIDRFPERSKVRRIITELREVFGEELDRELEPSKGFNPTPGRSEPANPGEPGGGAD